MTTYGRGYRATFLGHVPLDCQSNLPAAETSVTCLLQASVRACDTVYLDVQPCAVVMYNVDNNCKVTRRRDFNIARLSFCSGDAASGAHRDEAVFAWVYQEEGANGTSLQCYAVLMDSHTKSRRLAMMLNMAFQNCYRDVQVALRNSQLFRESCEERKRMDTRRNRTYIGENGESSVPLQEDLVFL